MDRLIETIKTKSGDVEIWLDSSTDDFYVIDRSTPMHATTTFSNMQFGEVKEHAEKMANKQMLTEVVPSEGNVL